MEYSNLLELIKTVSESNISNFKYEEGNVKIIMSSSEMALFSDGVNQIPMNVENTVGTITNIIKSPLVGTFYSSPSEDGEPFVKVGDIVSKGKTVAIVEAMKLLNDIESEYDGVVSEILVKNGESVEYGQPLFAIK
ncbi:MAG: acetyl-CoA carboxylase, biotin carboxyl carrier protein [Clostridiales bacterium]|nr:acetyl-CoA carboxylase, biotin carboxyl carrier protein [Clostridiales bacterium]